MGLWAGRDLPFTENSNPQSGMLPATPCGSQVMGDTICTREFGMGHLSIGSSNRGNLIQSAPASFCFYDNQFKYMARGSLL